MLAGLEDVVVATVAKGEKVVITGFLTFDRAQRVARTGSESADRRDHQDQGVEESQDLGRYVVQEDRERSGPGTEDHQGQAAGGCAGGSRPGHSRRPPHPDRCTVTPRECSANAVHRRVRRCPPTVAPFAHLTGEPVGAPPPRALSPHSPDNNPLGGVSPSRLKCPMTAARTTAADGTGPGPGGSTAGCRRGAGAFGPNAWLVEDMYDQFRADPPRSRNRGASSSPTTGRPACPTTGRQHGACPRWPAAPRPAVGHPPAAGRGRPGGHRGRPRRSEHRRRGARAGARPSGARPAGSWPTWRPAWASRPPPASGWCRPSFSRSTARSSTTSWPGPPGRKVSFTHLIGYAVVAGPA